MMNPNSPNSPVMDLVSYFERQATTSSQAPLAHPQAKRPGSAGKLLAMDANLDSILNSQSSSPESHSIQSQTPMLARREDKFGKPLRNTLKSSRALTEPPVFPATPQSIHRRGVPGNLKISQPETFAAFHENSSYITSADVSTNPFSSFASFSPAPLSADRANFPSLNSPIMSQMSPQASPRRKGHARHDSHLSIASIDSSHSLFFDKQNFDLDDGMDVTGDSSVTTPPSSPRKRKSPAKSPQKAKDRPNYLDKAVMRETGVTQQQINDQIGDPLPSDPKNWRCLWEGCSHVAARKENIRAHVQTHLGDRPYECPECHADFVRPHDFTRHYTTHVDSRDFKCPDCPQAFNRADALQRHRDRDFCNGGVPPGSPTKVKRALELMDRKKDTTGRRQKKNQSRKRTLLSNRQDSAELSDAWWSSTADSPDCMSSDPGSPDMIIDGLHSDSSMPISSQQIQAPGDFHRQSPNSQDTIKASSVKRPDQIIEELLSYTPSPNVQSSNTYSLSPPSSPEETHARLPLKKFSPKQQNSNQNQGPTPPASRDSMFDFLSAGTTSVNGGGRGAQTVASAPSLPDLSSASPSPIAFETVTDFDEFYSNFTNGSDAGTTSPDWFDWQGDFGSLPAATGAQTQEYRLGDLSGNDWIKHSLFLDRTDSVSPDEILAGL